MVFADACYVTPVSQQPRVEDQLAHANLVMLVDRARAGDADAWEVLYRRAYPTLLAYAAARLGPLDAEDAGSETMARAVRNISKFEWRGVDFTGWLFGIHRHVITDAQRTQCRPSPAAVDERDDHQPLEDIIRRTDHLVRDVRAAPLRVPHLPRHHSQPSRSPRGCQTAPEYRPFRRSV